MAKLTRYTAKLFGSGAGTNQMSEFGSLAAGTPDRFNGSTITPTIIQSLSNYLNGWFDAVVNGNALAMEDLNAVCYLFAYQIAYGLEMGVPEYDSGTTYFTGSMVNENSLIYASLIDNNIGNDPASTPADWKLLGSNPMTSLGDIIYGLANGVPQRLAGNTTTAIKVLTQVGTGSASAAPIWLAAGATQTRITSGTGTYTPPVGCIRVRVRAVGGGGGAGGCSSVSGGSGAGAGGGGGGYVEKIFSPPAASYSYAVGTGGAGGTSGVTNGTAGGNTTFGTLTATGGSNGSGTAAATTANINSSGGGGGAATGGDINIPGGCSIAGYWFASGGPAIGGVGGSSLLALPAFITSSQTTPVNAVGFGGGGNGGASINNSGAQPGGNGSNGVIIIDEFYI